ncbi:hypothetical protein Tco_1027901 [Tanacetum coccineum]
MSSLKKDTHSIKTIMTEMYEAFKGQSLSSVTPTLALTHIPVNVEGENATNTTTKEPLSYTEGETGEPKMAIPISTIQPTEVPPTQAKPYHTINHHPESSQAFRINKGKGLQLSILSIPQKMVPASTIVRLILMVKKLSSYMIKWEVYTSLDKEMQAHLDKEEKLRKAVEEEKLLAISKPEVKSSKRLRILAGEKFKKAQDAEHQVLKREHSQKVKRLTELNKKRARQYMNNDKRNFDVHQPFKFTDFGITDLDELGSIIQKKKNSIVKDLMTSLIKRYERLKKIPEELGIQYALPVPVPEQASS